MASGIVKWFNAEKGFGFIEPDGGGPDLFVHIRSCADGIDKLLPDQRVRFEQQPSRRHAGKVDAVNVMLVR
jgi:cold shock protein